MKRDLEKLIWLIFPRQIFTLPLPLALAVAGLVWALGLVAVRRARALRQIVRRMCSLALSVCFLAPVA